MTPSSRSRGGSAPCVRADLGTSSPPAKVYSCSPSTLLLFRQCVLWPRASSAALGGDLAGVSGIERTTAEWRELWEIRGQTGKDWR